MKRSCCDKECDWVCKWFDVEESYCVQYGRLDDEEVEEGCGGFEDWMGKES